MNALDFLKGLGPDLFVGRSALFAALPWKTAGEGNQVRFEESAPFTQVNTRVGDSGIRFLHLPLREPLAFAELEAALGGGFDYLGPNPGDIRNVTNYRHIRDSLEWMIGVDEGRVIDVVLWQPPRPVHENSIPESGARPDDMMALLE